MPPQARSVVPPAAAAAALLGVAPAAAVPVAVPPAEPPAVPVAVPEAVPIAMLLASKHKDVLVSWSIKLPLALKRELEDVARFHEIPMSEIVVAATRRALAELEHPPAGWRKPKR